MDYASILTVLKTIVVLVLVIFLANISLKALDNYSRKQNRSIKVIEKVSIFNNSAIAIVEICGTYYLMSFSDKENKILKELHKEEVESIIEDIKEDKSYPDLKSKLDLYFGMRKKS